MPANAAVNAPVETGWIQTFTGKKFHPLEPRAADIDVQDIAHALSLMCRFNGMSRCFYGVAQHSYLVAQNCPFEDALWGLLHDAPEAYLVDLPRPIKQRMREMGVTIFDDAERRIMDAVCERFGLPREEPPSVKVADNLLLVTESRDLMSPLHPDWHYCEANGYRALPAPIEPWQPGFAERMFLGLFDYLVTNR